MDRTQLLSFSLLPWKCAVIFDCTRKVWLQNNGVQLENPVTVSFEKRLQSTWKPLYLAQISALSLCAFNLQISNIV